jgi:ubiquinone/menaquinone biosynthesis C-methylase UbiE
VREVLRAPYVEYERAVAVEIRPGDRVLELGAGTGLHTEALCATGAKVTCCDIAPVALELLRRRLGRLGFNVECLECPMQRVPVPPSSFDHVVCAGSMSYAPPHELDAEIVRVLRPAGSCTLVDSLGNNPIYRLNRWVHWRIRGDRTHSTLGRIPTFARMATLGGRFEQWSIKGFGAWAWACGPVARVIGERAAARVADSLDRIPGSERMGFKFVFAARCLRKA